MTQPQNLDARVTALEARVTVLASGVSSLQSSLSAFTTRFTALEQELLAGAPRLAALEESARSVEDPFLKQGVEMLVDGTEPHELRDILEAKVDAKRAKDKAHVAAMQADLHILAQYEEQYAAENHGQYFSGTATPASPLNGFRPSTDVTITTTAFNILGSRLADWTAIARIMSSASEL